MKEDSIKLLEEINTGCQMAINSFHQFREFELRDQVEKMLEQNKDEHTEIQSEAARLLNEFGGERKEPGMMATAMSWITTEMKMLWKSDSTQVAKLMMDGCNMGIQSIGEAISKYPKADEEVVALARKLIKTEENFLSEAEEFL
ncbi:MAG: hypothetical protein IJW67_03140 [Blautia sp.]|nr:hypothetical protein [Blautia sp.]